MDGHGQPTGYASWPWLRGVVWDVGLLGWGWVPFYLFVVGVLGLTGEWSAAGRAGAEPGLGLAILVALAINYVHRHYTFFLVYGDRETFNEGRGWFTWGPAIAFVAVALAYRSSAELRLPVPGVEGGVSPWALVLVANGAWNVWHTIMQRYGIGRVYAGKAGGGLQSPEHGRRDRRLLWVSALWIAVVVLTFRQSTFDGIGNARRLLAALSPWLSGTPGRAVLFGVSAAWVAAVVDWARVEFRAAASRGPRWVFMGSTAALLAIFVVHGPVIGYLCFGTAHALEYVAFVHHFGRRKFRVDQPDRKGLVVTMLRNPLVSAPLAAGALMLAFVLLAPHRRTEAYLVYYTATSMLHFLFDGLIWKVRRPSVARPLGLR